MTPEKNIAVSKVQKLQGESNAIIADLDSTRINKQEAKQKIQRLKSAISENSRIIDNKCPENVEILRKKTIWKVN